MVHLGPNLTFSHIILCYLHPKIYIDPKQIKYIELVKFQLPFSHFIA